MTRRCPKNRHIFLNWLRTNRNRLLFRLRLVRYHRNCIEFNFIELTSAISVLFYPKSGIMIEITWDGICWDLIGDFDVVERRTDAGYYCALCKPEYQVFYPTREEFWITHGFEPFLEWCNTKLASANWLELFDYGVTSARLHTEKPDDDQHWESIMELADNLVPFGKTKPEKRITEIRKFIMPVRRHAKF